MPSGVQNQIGIGQAQVLPNSPAVLPFVQQLQEQKQLQFQRDRFEQAKKEQDDKELYGIVGDALNLKDFNPVIQDKVRKAQIDLTQWIKTNRDKPNMRGETYLMAQNKAAELGLTSQALNQADQVIAAQKKEWDGDKRINSANLELLARKDILDELNKTGKIDPNVNYLNRTLRKYPKFALTDNGEFSQMKFLPEELQNNLTGKYKKQNSRGGVEQFDWKIVGNFAPGMYDFKDNGENAEPTITVKSELSGWLDGNKKELPMLSEEAWGRYGAVTSNIVDLDRRIDKKYNGQIDLESPEAEILRRVEAYKDVEKMKPKVTTAVSQKDNPAPNVSIRNYSGGSSGTSQIDLREYKDVQGGKDITPLMQGVDVVSLVTGKKFSAKEVIYNPATQRITITDPVSNKPEEMSLTSFLQNAKPQNPVGDIKFLQGLRNAITGAAPQPHQPTNQPKEKDKSFWEKQKEERNKKQTGEAGINWK